MAAITLGRLVIVRARSAANDRLFRHELVHVGQWRRHGVVGFLGRYVGGYLRGRVAGWPHIAAYRRIGLEAEAEWLARGGDRP